MNETERINLMISALSGITDKTFLEREIRAWRTGWKRRRQLTGYRYYLNDHDIKKRRKHTVGAGGDKVENKILPLRNLIDNQFALMVDQKTNYIVGKPVSFKGADDGAAEERAAAIDEVLQGADFGEVINEAVSAAYLGGISWLYPYLDEEGDLCVETFYGHEIMPLWADKKHSRLDAAVRLYEIETYMPNADLTRRGVVEVYTTTGIFRWYLDGDVLEPIDDGVVQSFSPYFFVSDSLDRETPYTWGRVPLIAVKTGREELPLIVRCKGLQDALNEMISLFAENIDSNPFNSVLVVTGYEGENLGEFRENLAKYGAVKIKNSNTGAVGGVESLEIKVDATNYQAILSSLKNAIVQNTRGFDSKDDRLTSGQANQMNIQSLYAIMDLDANRIEAQLTKSMDQLFWFVDIYNSARGAGTWDADEAEVDTVFDRDVLVNEGAVIDDIVKSRGIISDETLVYMHPYVSDPEAEWKRVQAEREDEGAINSAFSEEVEVIE